MMTRSDRLPLLFATGWLVAVATAQEAVDAAPPAPLHNTQPTPLACPRVPLHTAAPDSGSEYGLWAAAGDYKASFHDGATFVPYLGRDYPRLQSLHWRTLSVRVGETELCDGKAPRLAHGEFRAEYDLGAVVEAYDIRDDGLEQTFVIARRPAAGDLVVRGAVATDLHATPTGAAHGELVFVDDAGAPILTYGAATAVDAAGRSCAMTTAFDGEVVSLRLDGAWLQTATFPVTVDPLIGNVFQAAGDELESVDVVRDTNLSTGNIWRSAARYAATNDGDLFLVRVDDDGMSSTSVFSDITTSWSSTQGSLGLHHHSACTLLAFTRHLASNLRKIRFHKHLRSDFSLQTGVGAVSSGAEQGWRPDVGTDLDPISGAQLLVVFQQENVATWAESTTSTIRGAFIDLSTNNGSAGTPFVIAQGAFEDHERPCVGKIRFGNGSDWSVASQVIGNAALSPHIDWDLRLVRVDGSGVVSAPTVFGLGNGSHELAPALAGFNADLQLSLLRSDPAVVGARPTGSGGMVLVSRMLHWTGTQFAQVGGGWILSSNPDPRVELCGSDIDTLTMSHYAVAYRSTVTDNVYLRTLGYTGQPLDYVTVVAPAANQTAVGGAVAFDDDDHRFLIGYGINSVGGTGVSYVDAYAMPSQPAPIHSGLGCSAAQLSWQGSQLIGDAGCNLRLSGMPSGALATVLVGSAPYSTLLTGTPMVHPGCWLLVPNTGVGYMATLPIGFGPTVNYGIDLPEWLPPMSLFFQGVHFDGSMTEVFTTDRFEVPLVK